MTRCLACRAKLGTGPAGRARNCPMCGLTLVAVPGRVDYAPLAAPRIDAESAWRALARARRLPDRPGATERRSARLLLAPFWRGAPGVISGLDLRPIGLPPLTASRSRVAGLGVDRATRTGDAMGRLPEPVLPAGTVVLDPLLDPPEGDWRLVYHPVWALHYALYSKEHFHVVDAVTGEPVGPALRIPWGPACSAAAGALFLLHLAAAPLLGPAAAIPAWAGATALLYAVIRSRRGA